MKCHRLVRIAVARSMTPKSICLIFNCLVFFLNATFPTQAEGKPLHDQWERCEELTNQVSALLESYSTHQINIGSPVLLCEVVTRCSW